MSFTSGERLTAARLNAEIGLSLGDYQATVGTTTSTSYTATLTGGTACGVAFTAPPSGTIIVHMTLGLFNSGANLTYCTWRLRTGASIGSGSDVVGASDDFAIIYTGTSRDQRGRMKIVGGLTPASSYNVQQLFRVAAGTGSFQAKELVISPA